MYYHVTHTKFVRSIRRRGLLPGVLAGAATNWTRGSSNIRYGGFHVYAFDHPDDAVRWAAKMGWDYYQNSASPKVSIVAFEPGDQKWDVDGADPMLHSISKGRWLRTELPVKSEQIVRVVPLNGNLVRAVIKGAALAV